MRLFVSLANSTVNDLKFDRGPIYIGRQMGSQVFLPDRAVSRQHAVIYTTKDGEWIIEDLGSPNKTFLNDTAVHKAQVKHGDIVRIADFSIRICLEDDEDQDRRMQMEDTLVGESAVRRELHTLDRKFDAADAPPIRFAPKRIFQLHAAYIAIGAQKTIPTLHKAMGDLLFDQFAPKNIWLGLRSEPTGPMEVQGGRQINTQTIERVDLAVPKSLAEAIEQNHYILIHQLPRQITARGIRSVLICPVMLRKDSFGIIYIENSTEHTHYSLSDLDYLVLLSIFAAYCIQKIK